MLLTGFGKCCCYKYPSVTWATADGCDAVAGRYTADGICSKRSTIYVTVRSSSTGNTARDSVRWSEHGSRTNGYKSFPDSDNCALRGEPRWRGKGLFTPTENGSENEND